MKLNAHNNFFIVFNLTVRTPKYVYVKISNYFSTKTLSLGKCCHLYITRKYTTTSTLLGLLEEGSKNVKLNHISATVSLLRVYFIFPKYMYILTYKCNCQLWQGKCISSLNISSIQNTKSNPSKDTPQRYTLQ